ncbi:MAG: 3-dehydroquinate synthase [Pyrinomonadaceae bacterium]|nr:3-dehydroquinate synthase [Pyrinomonadaceae bacterium]
MIHATVPIKLKSASSRYDIRVGTGLLATCGDWATSSVPEARRAIIVSNKKVFGLYGDAVQRSLAKAGLSVSTHLIGDGERFKSLKTLEQTLAAFNANGISRTDVVVALGGGVVGDLAGFAAAVHLRGVKFLQMPTTLLAMIDSSVGGKTGVNSQFGKNLIGAFHQPAGVLIDADVLATLPRRELTAGFCEAVKQGAIGGRKLLDQTHRFLQGLDVKNGINELLADELCGLVARQVEFKAKIVAGDERESANNETARSRKILNFGHTFAHALEKATDYRYLRHGEAVGLGILFAAELSKKLEFLSADDVTLLNAVVRCAGRLPALDGIDREKVAAAFSKDKKVIGDSLQWILLRGIGKPVILPGSNIPPRAVKEILGKFIR